MNKGVIVQLDYNTAYILKNDGTFVSCIRDGSWRVGDVITVPNPYRSHFKFMLASCLLVMCLGLGAIAFLYNTPSTYIEISVNPSVQLTLNRFNRALDITSFSDDGNNIIEGMGYKHLALDEVYARLLNKMENSGYLKDANVQLVIASDSQKRIYNIEERLKTVFEKYSDSINVTVKRYGKDEYVLLEHPLPVVEIEEENEPKTTNEQPNTTNQPSANSQQNGLLPRNEVFIEDVAPSNIQRHGHERNGWWKCD